MKNALTLIVVVLTTVGLFGCSNRSSDHERMSARYRGTLKTVHGDRVYSYTVLIDEVDYGKGLERIVHLSPTKEGVLTNVPSITGHDYAANGNWNRLFYGDYLVNSGTNSFRTGFSHVHRQPSGDWTWEPCPYDSERGLKQFTLEQILFAIMELDKAVAKIRTPEHLIDYTFWVQKDNRCTMIRAEDARPTGL